MILRHLMIPKQISQVPWLIPHPTSKQSSMSDRLPAQKTHRRLYLLFQMEIQNGKVLRHHAGNQSVKLLFGLFGLLLVRFTCLLQSCYSHSQLLILWQDCLLLLKCLEHWPFFRRTLMLLLGRRKFLILVNFLNSKWDRSNIISALSSIIARNN